MLFFIEFILAEATLQEFEYDFTKISQGNLKVTFIGHGKLMFTFRDKIVHTNPVDLLLYG